VNSLSVGLPRLADRFSLIGVTTNDVTTFESADVAVAERPTVTLTIAGAEYEVQCPKLRVWMGVIDRQEDYNAGQAFKPHIQELYQKLAGEVSDEERVTLLDQFRTMQPVFAQAPTMLQLSASLLEFLCSCMVSTVDADRLRAGYLNDNGPVDIPHLRRALDEMDSAFEDWLEAQAEFVGVKKPELPPRPEPANRADRRAQSRRSPSGKQPVKVAKRPVRTG
jgi:hypothetical protein